MKKMMVILLAVFFALPVFNASAARMKNWTWRRYRLKFKMPSNWRVTKNNRYSFIAKGPNVVMKIKPYRNRRASARGVAMYAYRTYTVISGKRILLRNYGSAKYNRSKYNIFGTGRRRGKKVYFRINGMISTRSANNVYVRIWWYGRRANSSRIQSISRRVGNSLRFY